MSELAIHEVEPEVEEDDGLNWQMLTDEEVAELSSLRKSNAYRVLSLREHDNVVIPNLETAFMRRMLEVLLGPRLIIAHLEHERRLNEDLDKIETEVRRARIVQGVNGR